METTTGAHGQARRFETLGQFLNRRRQELSALEGRPYDEIISWRELAGRVETSESNMLRWEKDAGLPRPQQLPGLVRVFGPGIYAAILNTSGVLGDMIAYESEIPEMARLVREMEDKVQDILDRHRRPSATRAAAPGT